MSIRYLESADHVKQAIAASMSYTPNTSKALEISSCITQGLRFFDSSKTSKMEIKPLLCFYGMSAFSKALILSRTKQSLVNLKAGHGIQDVTTKKARIAEMKLKINSSGTFAEFNDVASKIECITIYGEKCDEDWFIPTSPSNQLSNIEVSIDDIWARSTFLGEAYKTTFKRDPKNIHLSISAKYGEDEVKKVKIIQKAKVITIDDVKSLVDRIRINYPVFKKLSIIDAEFDGTTTTLIFANFLPDNYEFERLKPGHRPGSFAYNPGLFAYHDKISNNHNLIPINEILPPLAGGVTLSEQRYIFPFKDKFISEWAYLYMGCFLLSSFCRYRPDDWMHAIQSRITPNRALDNKALYLVDLFLEYALKEFPKYISSAINIKLPETGNRIERPRNNIWL